MIIALQMQYMQKRKYKKKTERRKLTEKLDAICAKLIFERDKYTCQKCGKYVEGRDAHPSHVLGKKVHPHLRFDLLNIKTLCMYCHRRWHLEPLEATDFFKTKFPERYGYLMEKKNDTKRLTVPDLKDLIEKLRGR